jgi:hypothetical protein
VKDDAPPHLMPEAEVMLLLLAANGGEMLKDDIEHEFGRVMALTDEQRREWRERIAPLARAHARRLREGQS